MNKTANFQLNQWVETDRIQMADFNSDNQKIDAALAAGTKFAAGSYTGTNQYGSAHPNTLTFDFTPKALILFNGNANSYIKAPMMLVAPAETQYFVYNGTGGGYEIKVTWGEKSVSWYGTNSSAGAQAQMNSNYGTYFYLAIGQ